VGQGRLPILYVPSSIDEVAGISVAVAEAAIVEQVNRQALLGETLGKGGQSKLALEAKAVGHDHDGRILSIRRQIQIAAAMHAPARKIR
jgi:hypothetical protein